MPAPPLPMPVESEAPIRLAAHLRPTPEVAAALGVDPRTGLSADEAARRLGEEGPNKLAEAARRPAWLRFVDQFRSVLILVLIGAAVLAGIVGDRRTPIVITIVLLINATLGFVMENRAERSLDALRNMLSPVARVRRGGRAPRSTPPSLVPGDVVLLEAGDRVAADGRLARRPEPGGRRVRADRGVAAGGQATAAAPPSAARPLGRPHRHGLHEHDASPAAGRAGGHRHRDGHRGRRDRRHARAQQSSRTDARCRSSSTRLGKRLAVIAGVAVAASSPSGWSAAVAGRAAPERRGAGRRRRSPRACRPSWRVTLALGLSRMASRGAIVKRLAVGRDPRRHHCDLLATRPAR